MDPVSVANSESINSTELVVQEEPTAKKESPKTLYINEYVKLFNIIEKVIDDFDRKHIVASAFRLFKVLVSSDPTIVHDDMTKVRVELLAAWSPKKTLDEILLKTRNIQATNYSNIKVKKIPTLHIAAIYEHAKKRQKDAKENGSLGGTELEIAPEIIRLHLSRIFNMIEEDDRLTEEIGRLENFLRTGSSPTSVVQLPMDFSGMLGTFANMAQSVMKNSGGNMPQNMKSIMQLAPELMKKEMFDSLSKGEFGEVTEKLRKTMRGHKEVLGVVRGIADNDLVRNLAQQVGGFMDKSGLAPMGIDLKNLDINQIVDKIESDLDREDEPVASSHKDAEEVDSSSE